MNSTVDVILVNRCNQSDGFQTVLPAKTWARLGIWNCKEMVE